MSSTAISIADIIGQSLDFHQFVHVAPRMILTMLWHVRNGAILFYAMMLCETQAMIMKKAGCSYVKLVTHLLPVDAELYQHSTNVQDESRLDISAPGIYGTFERTFCDVRVTNPYCPSNVYKPLDTIYLDHEKIKEQSLKNVWFNPRKVQLFH